ncbi:MAG: TIM barrel protein [Chitinophagaceae bacterium]|nr:TIM barrel protein [Chitinophagaceae bacterium]
MERRSFIKSGLFSGAALATGVSALATGTSRLPANQKAGKEKPFTLKFSPDFGIFSELGGKDPVDQVKWGYDQGFRAWENTMLKRRTKEEQERISKIIQQLGMEFGQFVGTMSFSEVTFAGNNQALRENVLQEVRESVEVARRMNTKLIHNVLGLADRGLSYDFQMLNAAELLKRIADIYEPHGITMLMETMNHKINHPGMFLHTIPQAYALAKMVNRPSVKILYDFYHVQIEEGNLLPAFDAAYDEIAYVQVGDTPGRKEPTTGEINYPLVLRHIHDKGYRGFIGLEHGIKNPGSAGELAALNAYRSIDIQ